MTRFSMATASRKRIFRRGAKRERGVWLFGGDYSISRTDTLLFVFRWLLLASVLKAFLSIKYTALLSFLFSCVSFFLFYLSIYQLVHTPFLSPPSLPYPIPSSSDFFLFFFFLVPPLISSPLDLSRHSLLRSSPFLHGRLTDCFRNSISSLRL